MAKKYEVVFNDLRQRIIEGEYKNGDKLPTESEMIKTYSVSRQTVRQALGMLEEEGLLSRSQGKGSFVTKRTVLNTKRVAVITFEVTLSVFPVALKEIEHVLFENGYTTQLFSTGGSATKERKIFQQLCSDPVDGIILYATESSLKCGNIDLILRLKDMGTKFVLMDTWYGEKELADIPAVTMADYEGAYQVVSELIDRGFKSFGGMFTLIARQSVERLNGMRQAILDHGLSLCSENFIAGAGTEYLGVGLDEYAKDHMLQQEVIVCSNEVFSNQVLKIMETMPERKVRCIVSFDNDSVTPPDGVEAIALMHDSRGVGRMCAEKVLNMIRGGSETSVCLPWYTHDGKYYPDNSKIK